MEYTKESLAKALSNKEIVVVDFWAEWCAPCRSLGPIIDEVGEFYSGEPRVIVGKLDIDLHEELAAEYGIRSIPTVVFFRDGKLDRRISGASEASTYSEIIEHLLEGGE